MGKVDAKVLKSKIYDPIVRFKGVVLWICIAGLYIFGQAALYAQDRSPTQTSTEETPWQHLSLEGALAIAVGVQYRENRQKEESSVKLSSDAAAAIARATEIMENVTGALERLSGKVDQCPIRASGYSQQYPPRSG